MRMRSGGDTKVPLGPGLEGIYLRECLKRTNSDHSLWRTIANEPGGAM